MKTRLIITLLSLIVVIVSCNVPNSDSKQNDTCIVSDTCQQANVSNPNYTAIHIHVDTIMESEDYCYFCNLCVTGYDDRGIFQDTTKSIDSLRHICYNDSIHYLLLYENDPVSYRNLWVISFVKNRWVHSDCILSNRILDLDNDGIFEVVGIELTEAVCMDCDSCYYSPYEVYRLGETLERDTMWERVYNEACYGFYDTTAKFDSIVKCNREPYYYNGKELP